MARRDFDFTKAQKFVIIAYYGGVCAACGADDGLQADHWIAGDSSDEGVCLCYACNYAKSNTRVPIELRLTPRESLNVITHQEYKQQVAANREAFANWVSKYRCAAKLKTNYFKAPF